MEGKRSIMMSMSVCLSVCLPSGMSHDPHQHTSQVYCARGQWPWPSLYLATLRYAVYFRFCG